MSPKSTVVEAGVGDDGEIVEKQTSIDYDADRLEEETEPEKPAKETEPKKKEAESPEPVKVKEAKPKPKEKPEEELPDAEAETETEVVEGEEKPAPKKKGRLQKRLNTLTQQKYEREERIAQLEAQLASGASKPEVTAKPEKEAAEPKYEDFETFEEYNEARIAYGLKKGIAEYKAEEAAQKQNASQQELIAAYQKRVGEARDKYEDWDEVSEAAAKYPIPPGVQILLMELENGPDVIYHIASHDEIAQKLSGMSDVRAIAEIGKLAASLESTTATNETKADGPSATAEKPGIKPVSKAPKPIKPVGASSATSNKLALDDESVSMAEYNRRRDAGEGGA